MFFPHIVEKLNARADAKHTINFKRPKLLVTYNTVIKIWAALREKVPIVLSHTKRRMDGLVKKDGDGRLTRPSFFWYDTDLKKNQIFFSKKKKLNSWCHTKKRMDRYPSFGMTTTQDIIDLFV